MPHSLTPDDVGRDLDVAAVRAERPRGHAEEARQGILGAARTGKSQFVIWYPIFTFKYYLS